MRWQGETVLQWRERTNEWHLKFLLWPRQMYDGEWVWLEYAWAKRTHGWSWMTASWIYTTNIQQWENVNVSELENENE